MTTTDREAERRRGEFNEEEEAVWTFAMPCPS